MFRIFIPILWLVDVLKKCALLHITSNSHNHCSGNALVIISSKRSSAGVGCDQFMFWILPKICRLVPAYVFSPSLAHLYPLLVQYSSSQLIFFDSFSQEKTRSGKEKITITAINNDAQSVLANFNFLF